MSIYGIGISDILVSQSSDPKKRLNRDEFCSSFLFNISSLGDGRRPCKEGCPDDLMPHRRPKSSASASSMLVFDSCLSSLPSDFLMVVNTWHLSPMHRLTVVLVLP